MADTNYHDTGYKELFSYPEFVQQLIEGFAPSEIADLMDFRTLQNYSGNYITPLFEEKFEDVVWSVAVTSKGLSQRVYHVQRRECRGQLGKPAESRRQNCGDHSGGLQ